MPVPPRPDEVPPPATWSPWEAVPAFALAVVGAGAATAPLALVVRSCGGRSVLVSFLGELAFAGAAVFWVKVVNRGPLAALGLPRRPARDLRTGLLGAAGLLLVAYAAAFVVIAVASAILGHRPAQPEQIQSCITGTSLGLSGLVVVLVAPFGEEIFFRGFLYKSLRNRFSPWPAALISSVAFALVHVSPILILSIFPVGVLLALVYERRQSLLAAMVAHAGFNLVGFLLIVSSR